MGTICPETEVAFPPVIFELRQIRILEVEAGEEDSPIVCRYHIASLEDLSYEYEALSYAWHDGYSDNLELLHIDSGWIKVTTSLFQAVKRLRRTDSSRYLWVDALCINQSDDNEKTKQVDLMGEIYTKCKQCIIWLGTAQEVSSESVKKLFEFITWLAGEQSQPTWADFPEECTIVCDTLKKFMHLPWWLRIWTVQETILPANSTVVWGEHTIDRSLLYRGADSFFDDTAPALLGELWEQGAIIDFQGAMRGLGFSHDEPVLEVLWRWRYRNATDPRDKVYALMSFREDNWDFSTVRSCDYSMDVLTLFSRVTADLIRKYGSLVPVIGQRNPPSHFSPEGKRLPSWAVDWAPPPEAANHITNFWGHLTLWDNCDFTPDKGLVGVRDELRTIGDSILLLNGMRVDKVVTVERADSDRTDGPEGSPYSRLFKVIERWGEVVDRFQAERPERLRRSWMRDLVAVASGRFNSDDPEEGNDLESYITDMVLHQSLFITETGLFGLGPKSTKPGDQLWVIGGSKFPLLLKQIPRLEGTGDGTEDFFLVADCLVYGIMRGEAVEGREDEQVEIRLH